MPTQIPSVVKRNVIVQPCWNAFSFNTSYTVRSRMWLYTGPLIKSKHRYGYYISAASCGAGVIKYRIRQDEAFLKLTLRYREWTCLPKVSPPSPTTPPVSHGIRVTLKMHAARPGFFDTHRTSFWIQAKIEEFSQNLNMPESQRRQRVLHSPRVWGRVIFYIQPFFFLQ